MIILASSSLQRKNILKKLNISFKAIPANIDERQVEAKFKRPHSIVKAVSLEKANVVARDNPQSWVVGSDTVVVSSKGKLLTKPNSQSEAKAMIQSYQGSFCDVYSGLALLHLSLKKKILTCDKTRILFHDFSDDQMLDYLKIGDWKECSGALKIEKVGKWIKKIKGDYWNVVGLPVEALKPHLHLLRKG